MCISQQFGNHRHGDNKLGKKRKNCISYFNTSPYILLQSSFKVTMAAYINENKIVFVIIDLEINIFIEKQHNAQRTIFNFDIEVS